MEAKISGHEYTIPSAALVLALNRFACDVIDIIA